MPDEALRCHLLTVEDVEAFRALRLHGLKESPRAFLEDYEEASAQPVNYFRRYFENGWIAGAFLQNQLSGMAGLYTQKGIKLRHKGVVWGVYVLPEARGRGIAAQLIEMVVQEAKTAGIELVQLSTDETNPASLKLYERLGFQEYGREKQIMKVDGKYVTDVWMVRFLK